MVNELSPSEPKLNIIVRTSIRHDKVLPRALRLVKSIGGNIIDLDEELRRVVFKLPFDKIVDLKEVFSTYAVSYSIEVSSVIKLASLNIDIRDLIRQNLKLLLDDHTRIIMYYRSKLSWLIEFYRKKKVVKLLLLNVPELRAHAGFFIIPPSYYMFTDIDFLVSRKTDILSDFAELKEKFVNIST